jgi:hypothetical protein
MLVSKVHRVHKATLQLFLVLKVLKDQAVHKVPHQTLQVRKVLKVHKDLQVQEHTQLRMLVLVHIQSMVLAIQH